jgi:hypothetical protein
MQRHSARSRLGRGLAIVVAVTCTLITGEAAPAAAGTAASATVVGNPIVMVSNLSNGLCADGSLNDYETVVEEPCMHYSEQLWTISFDDGALILKNYHYDGCLDLVSPVGSGLVRQRGCSDQSSHWTYNGTDLTELPTPGRHVYQFYNVEWHKCLQGGGGPNSALIAMPCTGNRDQLWRVSY